MGTPWQVLGTISTIWFWSLVLYVLVFNPKFGQGNSRTLVLTVALALTVGATVVLGRRCRQRLTAGLPEPVRGRVRPSRPVELEVSARGRQRGGG